jgi:UDP-N-acetylmuramoyl-tripeptide--D-alanyl-D-alanine ligase
LITEHPFVALDWTDSISKAKGTIHSHLPGYYNFENLLAAACIGNYFGVSPVDIDRALSSYEPSNHRSQIIYAGTNKLFMDGYNANPTSMDVSLRSFAKEVAPNKLVILGKMMELGEFSAFEHEVIGKLAISFPHNKVVLIGKEYPNLSGVFKHFQSTDEAIDYFHANPVNDHTILIKGSRANALERLLEVFDQS